MHIFRLDKDTHRSFLEERRRDPITGDTFAPEDRVVFCASCKSAFLAESWEYIGHSHCGQQDTLTAFPRPERRLLRFEMPPDESVYPNNQRLEKQDTWRLLGRIGINFAQPIFFWMYFYYHMGWAHPLLIFLASLTLIPAAKQVRYLRNAWKSRILLNAPFVIAKKHVYLRNEPIAYTDLKEIDVELKKTFFQRRAKLTFYFKDGSTRSYTENLKSDSDLRAFLWALPTLAQNCPVRYQARAFEDWELASHLAESQSSQLIVERNPPR